MNRLTLISFAAVMVLLIAENYAYINVTSINTTVVLNNTPTARVIETLQLSITNNSAPVYQQDRIAVNLTISEWQKVLGDGQPSLFIVNPKSSTYGVTLLPGPLIYESQGDIAFLTLEYYARNVTTSSNIGPRKFEYVFNDSVFNFEHSVSGQSLPQDVRFNIVVPQGSAVQSLYPLPDSPPASFVNNYKNVTQFSWYSAEPLEKFTFSYILTESLQQEVINYFTKVYVEYGVMIAAVLVILVVVGALYWYTQMR